MKILIDQCIINAAELVKPSIENKKLVWGGQEFEVNQPALTADDSKLLKEDEVKALVAISNLIRGGDFCAYTYHELKCESWRRSPPIGAFNLFEKCYLEKCRSPIDRTKFQATSSFPDAIAKGGKKDKARGVGVHGVSQIDFFEFLFSLEVDGLNSVLKIADNLGLDDFEIANFRRLERFKIICKALQSKENYPDAYHVWTAEVNEIDVFLTTDDKLIRASAQIPRGEEGLFRVSIMRPTELLNSLGISSADSLPVERGRFYSPFKFGL